MQTIIRFFRDGPSPAALGTVSSANAGEIPRVGEHLTLGPMITLSGEASGVVRRVDRAYGVERQDVDVMLAPEGAVDRSGLTPKARRFVLEALDALGASKERLASVQKDDEDAVADLVNDVMFIRSLRGALAKGA